METKEHTLSKEQFAENKATWRRYCAAKVEGNTWAHLLVTLMYGHDPFKAFRPLTNPGHLQAHSGDPWYSLRSAATHLKSALYWERAALADPERYKKRNTTPGKLEFCSFGDKYEFNVSPAMLDDLEKKVAQIDDGIRDRS